MDGWTAATLLVTAGAYGISLAAAGTVLFRLTFPDLPAGLARSVDSLTLGLAVTALLLNGLRLAVQAGFLAGSGPAGMADLQLLAFIAGGPVGSATGWRAAGLLLLCALPLAGGGVLRRPAGAATLAGALLVCLSFLAIGHSTGQPRLLLAPLLLLHLLGIAFWIGALAPLYRAAGTMEPLAAAALMHRFGRLAGWAVAVLLLAGLGLAILLVGSIQALTDSGYGRLLLVKIALVAALLVLAAGNKLRLVPALRQGKAATVARLRRSIAAEMLLAALIVLLTASLVTLEQAPATLPH